VGATDTEARVAEAAAVGGAGKERYVRRIFSEIAPRYDFLNHLLSLNIDRAWRRRALRELDWERHPDGMFLDLCAGTLDVAVQLARQPGFVGRVVGADFAEPMLRAGAGKGSPRTVLPVAADALQLPLGAGVARGAVVAFGIRNVTDLDGAIAEVRRVLTPGARFVILEFSTPRHPVVRGLYHAYFNHVLPVIGGLVSGQRTAYRYLPRSVAHFPSPSALAKRLEAGGFARLRWYPLTLGIATLHVGERA
jgi:demethylmenaquinone methyltransferase / 2-methoxy-6-polyprenyl-1,4-benzoquinol methylase